MSASDEKQQLIANEVDTSNEDVDIVDVFRRRPIQRRLVQMAVLLYWAVVALLFFGAVSVTLVDELDVDSEALANIATLVDHNVSCREGIPKMWKAGILIFTLCFSVLEFWIAVQTKLGDLMLRSRKAGVAVALLFGSLARYDVLSDICFALIADACKSVVGLWSFVLFGLGVLLAQGVPSVCAVFGGTLHTHFGLKMLDFCLLLELVDSSRDELALPADVEKRMAGIKDETRSLEDQIVSAAGALHGDSGQVVHKVLSPEEVAKIKTMIETLSEEEVVAEHDDPDAVKNVALVARAKAWAGALRFIGEDLGQGVLQVKFLNDLWTSLDASTRAFTITSLLAGLATSLGGPVHAFYKERKNAQYYADLPKLKDGSEFQGITLLEGDSDGSKFQSWSLISFIFHGIVKDVDGSMRVAGKSRTQVVLREVGGSAIATKGMHSGFKAYLDPSGYSVYDETLSGTYNTKTSMLALRSDELNILHGDKSAIQFKCTYSLKLFPGKLKGTATPYEDHRGRPAEDVNDYQLTLKVKK